MAVTKSDHGFSSDNDVLAISATALPLPSGASTAAAQGQFRDAAGTLTNYKTADGKPRMSCTDYLYDIGEGTVSDHSIFDKFGINEDVDSAAEEDIWINGGSYRWPAAEQAMDVVSSSAKDTATTGTGAWTIRIYYLNASFVGKSIDVTLAGLTPVATSTSDIYRINRVRVLTAGTGLKAAGNIDVKATAPTATVYARVGTGQTMTRQCIHTVQASRVVYVTQMTVSIGGTTAPKFGRFILRSNYDFQSAVLRGVFYPFAEIGVNSMGMEENFQVPLKFPAGADIIVSCKTVDNDCNTTATLRGWQETV